MLLQTVIETVY